MFHQETSNFLPCHQDVYVQQQYTVHKKTKTDDPYKTFYMTLFEILDTNETGYLLGGPLLQFFLSSGLAKETLTKVEHRPLSRKPPIFFLRHLRVRV